MEDHEKPGMQTLRFMVRANEDDVTDLQARVTRLEERMTRSEIEAGKLGIKLGIISALGAALGSALLSLLFKL